MPGLRRYLESKPVGHAGEDSSGGRMQLWLPSDVMPDSRSMVCVDPVVEIEESIREARCFDMLALIRHNLRVKTRIPRFLMGQHCSEMSAQLTDRILTQVKDIAKQYRRNREALVSLRGEGQWEERLVAISDCDVKLVEPKETAEVAESVASIWGTASIAMETNVLLRGEWCRRWLLVQVSNAEVQCLEREVRTVV